MSAKGRNWGDAVLDNETLQFHTDGRALFNVALPDVVQVQDRMRVYLIVYVCGGAVSAFGIHAR